MKRVLLTSSQVSIILTSFVIFLCTLALFLSGYVIQQRTVKDLREAIRPRPRPVTKPHLPERFKARITELEDGSIVFYESEADEEARQQRQHIEVRETVKEDTPPEPEEARANQEEEMKKATAKQLQMLADIQSQAARQSWQVENPDPWAMSKVPVDAVERRQMIRDELKRLSISDGPVPWSKRSLCWDSQLNTLIMQQTFSDNHPEQNIQFQAGHIVRGVDFSDDPPLQGRIFSCLDTQINRHGGPNLEQVPKVHNNNRDGADQVYIHKNAAPYSPNTINKGYPQEANQSTGRGFFTWPHDIAKRVGQAINVEAPAPDDKYYHDNKLAHMSTYGVKLPTIASMRIGILVDSASNSSVAQDKAIKDGFNDAKVFASTVGEKTGSGVDKALSAVDATVFDAIIVADGTSALFGKGSKSTFYPPGRP